MDLLASGFHQVPGKFELAVKMTRIMFAFLLLVALAAQAMGVLNACNRFGVPALASTFFNIGSVTFGLILGYVLGPHLGIDPITGMAVGVVLGGALQLLWQLPSLRAEGFRFQPAIDWNHPAAAEDLEPDGPSDSRQRSGADQRAGDHQFRFADSRQRTGELAGLFVPFHAASAGPVSASPSLRPRFRPSRAAPASAISTSSAGRFPSRWGWCFC